MNRYIPQGAIDVIRTLKKKGYEAYLVGGCVRDMIMGRNPHDWDICTSALPREVSHLFGSVIETGIKHGTVTVASCGDWYEVTTYRIDGEYSDGRRPDSVEFTKDIVKDLSRRDFTMNAIAYDVDNNEFIDPFNGVSDIKLGKIRCVGVPDERFSEDGLRILRAVRFAAQLGFNIDLATLSSMMSNLDKLKNVSLERINSELTKTLLSKNPDYAMSYVNITCAIIPEFVPTVDYNQHSIWHSRTLYNHMAYALFATKYFDKEEDLKIRLAIMLHDISKPECKTIDEEGHYHFKGHGVPSSKTANDILKRLHYDNETIDSVTELIFYHDSFIDESKKSIRRWLNKIGENQFRRLLIVRECDVIAQSPEFLEERLKKVYRLRKLLNEILSEQSCVSLRNLAVNGKDIMAMGVPEGKKVGMILNRLLNLVLDDATLNNKEILLEEAKEMLDKVS